MKKNTLQYILCLLFLLITAKSTLAQVGINTTDPKGVIDFNSAVYGVVYPNVALTATDNPAPVINPQGGALAIGTVVYNTNTTSTGAVTDVFPGVYVWNGSQWMVHYKKRQSEIHNQTGVLRTESTAGFEDVPGLGVSAAKSFTAKYSGLYRIEVKTNFGGGRTKTNTSSYVSMASGQFRFLLDGTPYTFQANAFSAYTSYIAAGTYYEDVSKESYKTIYAILNAGTTYPFSLTFDAYDAPGFINNGSATGTPSSVNLVNQNFNTYTVVQTRIPAGGDPDCSAPQATNGWVVSTGAGTCTGCAGNRLYISSNRNNCGQNATARMSFTPTVNSVNIRFDYRFSESNSTSDSFRVYLHNGTAQVGGDLISLLNISANTSYSGTVPVVAGTTYTLRFEYINGNRGDSASVDNVVISELSGPLTPASDLGRGYVGNEVDCQIEFTYIAE